MNIFTILWQTIFTQPLWYLVLCLFYLLGTFPSGYFVAKFYGNIDITKVGSFSSGSTNVARNINRGAGLITFVLDISKCFLALWSVDFIVEANHLFWLQIAAFLVLLGHSKSVFLKFRGGKGVACSFAIWYYLSLPTGVIASVVWFLFYRWKKIVSLASIIVHSLIPILVWVFNKEFFYLSLVLCLYIIFLHLQNIKRLLRREEFVWTKK